MTDHRRQIEELLTRRIGLDPVSLGPRLIHRSTERRMAALGIVDLAEYAAHALESEAEQQALIEEVIVPESWFFRDERPFRWLADRARERWIASPWRPPLRVLSMPCAAGQEPYSIAITLRDAGLSGAAVPHRRGRRQRPDARDRPPRGVFGQCVPVHWEGRGVRGEGRGEREERIRFHRSLPHTSQSLAPARAAVGFFVFLAPGP